MEYNMRRMTKHASLFFEHLHFYSVYYNTKMTFSNVFRELLQKAWFSFDKSQSQYGKKSTIGSTNGIISIFRIFVVVRDVGDLWLFCKTAKLFR